MKEPSPERVKAGLLAIALAVLVDRARGSITIRVEESDSLAARFGGIPAVEMRTLEGGKGMRLTLSRRKVRQPKPVLPS